MEKKIIYVLSWKCHGKTKTREYDNEKLAQTCYDECKAMPAHSEVTLTRVTAELIKTTLVEKPRRRVFAIVTLTDGKRHYFETQPDKIQEFDGYLVDPKVFSVSFLISHNGRVPNFIRRKGFTNLTKCSDDQRSNFLLAVLKRL